MENNNLKIKGKNILISGGTTGIGRATAKLLVNYGANVMIFGRDKNHLDDAIFDIENKNGKIFGVTADVSDKNQVKEVFKKFEETYGDIDVLINNASLPARSILDCQSNKWQYIVNVNILGYLYCSSEAVNRMIKGNGGHLINIGSLSSVLREEGADIYVATKSAVEGFSDSLRKQIGKYEIKVSLIEPGSVGTNLITHNSKEQEILQKESKMLKAEDVAEAILFCLTRPKRCDIIELKIRPHK
ncbi:MAG: SDR family oxidoreductase [Patescibacteria group bacterium]